MTKILQHIGRQSRERESKTNALEALKIPLGTNTSGGPRSNARATLTGQWRLELFPVVGQKNMACVW